MGWDGWEDETEESLSKRTGVQRKLPEQPGPAPATGPDADPIVDGHRLSEVGKSWRGKNEGQSNADFLGSRGGGSHQRRDRGSRQGAKWVIVDAQRRIIEWQLAQEHKTQGRKFQSRREAKRYIGLLDRHDRGEIRNLQLQVRFPLCCKNAAGLIQVVCHYVCDFEYEERVGDGWERVVEDAKGWKQDAYILKSKWFAIQYGFAIRET